MKKEKSIQADIEVLRDILNQSKIRISNISGEMHIKICKGLESAIQALEEQALMRDASDALPDKKTYQNTGEWCDGGAYLAKGFNSCLDLCQVVTAKLLLEIKELKDAKKE